MALPFSQVICGHPGPGEEPGHSRLDHAPRVARNNGRHRHAQGREQGAQLRPIRDLARAKHRGPNRQQPRLQHRTKGGGRAVRGRARRGLRNQLGSCPEGTVGIDVDGAVEPSKPVPAVRGVAEHRYRAVGLRELGSVAEGSDPVGSLPQRLIHPFALLDDFLHKRNRGTPDIRMGRVEERDRQAVHPLAGHADKRVGEGATGAVVIGKNTVPPQSRLVRLKGAKELLDTCSNVGGQFRWSHGPRRAVGRWGDAQADGSLLSVQVAHGRHLGPIVIIPRDPEHGKTRDAQSVLELGCRTDGGQRLVENVQRTPEQLGLLSGSHDESIAREHGLQPVAGAGTRAMERRCLQAGGDIAMATRAQPRNPGLREETGHRPPRPRPAERRRDWWGSRAVPVRVAGGSSGGLTVRRSTRQNEARRAFPKGRSAVVAEPVPRHQANGGQQ